MPHAQSFPNRLIAVLPATERHALFAAGEPQDLVLAQHLGAPGGEIAHVYFPATACVSLIAGVDAESSLEVRMVGSEGMVGLPLALGVKHATLTAVVQGSGLALRIAAEPFLRQLAASPPLQAVLSRYAAVNLAQLAQTAACTRFHLVEERLARWLMMTQDRAHSDEFHLTHAFLSAMLGVRRVGVTQAATALQQRGLIRYQRGDIRIADRPGLEAAACSCYRRDLALYTSMMAPA